MDSRAGQQKNILYLTFLGILDPVAYSQVYGYLIELSKNARFRLFLVSFEKESLARKGGYLDYAGIKRALADNGIRWYRLRHRQGIAKCHSFIACLALVLYLTATKRISAIHARANEPAIIAYLVSRLFGVKFIYDRRGIMADDYADDRNTAFVIKKHGFIYRLIDGLEKAIMRRAAAIVVLTGKIKEHIGRDMGAAAAKVRVIPCCVDLSLYGKSGKNGSCLAGIPDLRGKFVLSYSGSLYNIHNTPAMADFFACVKKAAGAAHFVFLTLSETRRLEEAIRSKGLSRDDFTVLAVSPLAVNDYLSACDAAVMFFNQTFNRLASSPTKLGESLASGLPVVINRGVGDSEDLILSERVGVVVPEFSGRAYQLAAEELLRLAQEPGLRSRCRLAAEKNLSLRSGAEKYGRIYECL